MDKKDVNNDIANWFMHTEAPKYSESINLNISSTPPLHLIHYTLGDVHSLGIAIHYAVYDADKGSCCLCRPDHHASKNEIFNMQAIDKGPKANTLHDALNQDTPSLIDRFRHG